MSRTIINQVVFNNVKRDLNTFMTKKEVAKKNLISTESVRKINHANSWESWLINKHMKVAQPKVAQPKRGIKALIERLQNIFSK